MKKLIPYLIFGVAYFALVLGVGAAIDEIHSQLTNHVFGLLVPIAVAPIAIVAAKRGGSLSTFGVIVVTVFSTLGMYTVITAIYSSLATPVGGSVSPLSLARLGGWSLALSYLIYIVAPVLWLPFLKNRAPRNAQAHTVV